LSSHRMVSAILFNLPMAALKMTALFFIIPDYLNEKIIYSACCISIAVFLQ
jgi:hypothetical protein